MSLWFWCSDSTYSRAWLGTNLQIKMKFWFTYFSVFTHEKILPMQLLFHYNSTFKNIILPFFVKCQSWIYWRSMTQRSSVRRNLIQTQIDTWSTVDAIDSTVRRWFEITITIFPVWADRILGIADGRTRTTTGNFVTLNQFIGG